MADADDVRQLALGLPHVQEIDSDGFDFRVAGKGFVWSYPERRPGKPRLIRTDIAVLFVGDEAEKQALLLGEPEAFFTTPGYDGWPLVMLRLARVDVARLKELVTDAWRMRAPDALVGDLDEASDVSDADQRGTTSRQPTSTQTSSSVRLKHKDQRRHRAERDSSHRPMSSVCPLDSLGEVDWYPVIWFAVLGEDPVLIGGGAVKA
jgi:hypothetical protein